MTESTVRVGMPEDLAAVQELNTGAFENDHRHDPHLVMSWPTDPEGAAYFRRRLSGEGVVFIAEVNNEIVGYLAGAMHNIESYRAGVRSELENMFVRPAVRRLKIGSSLIEAFTQWSIHNNDDEIYVSAYFDNQDAVQFYKHNHFESYSHDLLLDLRSKRNSQT